MPRCDMCGKEGGVYTVALEGSSMHSCKQCARFGRVISHTRVRKKEPKRAPDPISEEEKRTFVVHGYGKRIRNAREKLQLNQKEFASRIQLKESLVHKMEAEAFEPNLKLAKRLERELRIKLIETLHETQGTTKKKISSQGLTIGDILKIKGKKI